MTSPSTASGAFAGKVAIVTGAASGIGLATTELLHAEGANVIAVGRGSNVEALARPGIVPLFADVSREDSAVRAVATAIDRFGRLDVLVNNAAIIINKPLIDMSLDDWNGIQAVNATGAFLFSREALRAMVPAKTGAIVNVGSYACYQAFPLISAYAASKGALAQLTRALSLEAIEHGIRVNAVGSGDVITNITNHIHADGQAFLAEHGKKAPIRRAAQPKEIAEVIAFLASEKASFIVGAVVMADGGMSVALP
ncbi:SDR family NAD(P)-dependent oxidoreductase [Burkholderia dolosa]|uniref:SDR family NAD(P)-dependent oxidoreductase n=1 Tax=Burkholderia dolosa TaxID=152500 RepID=UPI0015920573|nr:SDR family oxidoreductase [Burkholderia dolosa]MBR8460442.1 SDR family oxidoreductase [Burkholderia dolosa]MBY4752998.1 SDR family oxidoreductase [Burkholderia dolosa]MDN7421682.1 SDR family oxidoreductase [Burkholderia dolosa]